MLLVIRPSPGGFTDKFADKDGFECPLGIGGGVGGVMHPAMQQMAGGSGGGHGVMLMGDPYAGRKDITRCVLARAGGFGGGMGMTHARVFGD